MDTTEGKQPFRSGFVTVIGRPNVGKSTLLNQLLGEKFLIVSDKPQTTRNRIRCILTRPDMQAVFIDTPGIHKPQHKLGEYMVQTALRTLAEVDVVVLVMDLTAETGRGDQFILEQLKTIETPVILLLNKKDQVSLEVCRRRQEEMAGLYAFEQIRCVSALTGEGTAEFLDLIAGLLPDGPMYYPEDMVVDHPERFIVAELIREKVILRTEEEIPHAVAVEIEEMSPRPDELIYIRAVVYVERESQKGIVVGAGGRLLKQVGQEARKDIESLLGSRVYLDLWVRVKKDWRRRDGALRQFGYD